MGTVNVNRNVTDVFYRYKMPRINAKVEGKGNGIKTVIVNMAEVAKAIGRPATYPTKYFGCELGAQTQFDYKVSRIIHYPEFKSLQPHFQNLLTLHKIWKKFIRGKTGKFPPKSLIRPAPHS